VTGQLGDALSTHPLFGEVLGATGFRRVGGVLHLVVMLPDRTPGTIRAEATDVLGSEESTAAAGAVLSIEGIRRLRSLVLAQPRRRGSRGAGRTAP
jgi:hypothetical protein